MPDPDSCSEPRRETEEDEAATGVKAVFRHERRKSYHRSKTLRTFAELEKDGRDDNDDSTMRLTDKLASPPVGSKEQRRKNGTVFYKQDMRGKLTMSPTT